MQKEMKDLGGIPYKKFNMAEMEAHIQFLKKKHSKHIANIENKFNLTWDIVKDDSKYCSPYQKLASTNQNNKGLFIAFFLHNIERKLNGLHSITDQDFLNQVSRFCLKTIL